MMFWNRKSGHFPVLERPFPVFCVLLGKWFCPGTSRDICSCPCPRTKGHWDKNFFCPGTKGQRDVPSRLVPGRPVRGNPTQNLSGSDLLRKFQFRFISKIGLFLHAWKSHLQKSKIDLTPRIPTLPNMTIQCIYFYCMLVTLNCFKSAVWCILAMGLADLGN